MFTDYTKIIIKSGNGGNGAATFRREKYVAAGGPDRTEMEEMEEISISKLIKIKIHWQILDTIKNLELKMAKMVVEVIAMENMEKIYTLKFQQGQ